MGRGKQKKAKRKNVDPIARFVRPTEAREAHNDFRSAGAAVRIVPPIERLFEDGDINREEYTALAFYRDQASLADRSPVKCGIDFSVKGGGHGPGVAIMSAAIEAGRMEQNMGALWPLCRAVCVEDRTLEEWCLSQGSRLTPEEAHEIGNPKEVMEALMLISLGTPPPRPLDVAVALMELKYAAGGIVVNRK